LELSTEKQQKNKYSTAMYRNETMTKRKIKKYLTPVSLDYVIACKLKLAGILEDRGWNKETLSYATGIPQSTLSRWLDPDRHDFMRLADAAVISDCIGITVREMLADPMWRDLQPNDERYLFIRPLMEAPIAHVRVLTEFYWRFKDLFDKAS
jgi:DNA-binding Xre family transcriptional regulator